MGRTALIVVDMLSSCSALDAYIRHLQVCVPRDAVASIHPHLADATLELMERNMSAEICAASEVELGR
jgi:nicotinamidase-related amidase